MPLWSSPDWRFAMKRCSGTVLLVFVLAAGAYTAADNPPPRESAVLLNSPLPVAHRNLHVAIPLPNFSFPGSARERNAWQALPAVNILDHQYSRQSLDGSAFPGRAWERDCADTNAAAGEGPEVRRGASPDSSILQNATDNPRTVSPEAIAYLEKLRKNTPFGTNDFDLAGLRAGMGARKEPTLKDVQLMRSKIGEIPCEWVLAPGADPDVRLLYLHGGGWVSGTGGNYLPLAADISAAARCAVLLPDYRLAPEHPFPAGLEDCVAAHDWLVANGPAGPGPAKVTFIAGDSAGGNLTLATLLALRDRKRPLPAGGIAISAATDFTLSSESLKSVIDPIISARTMPEFRERYLEKLDPRNPLASPVFGDYRGIPPLLIQVGEHEMLRDDCIRAANKARSDGIPVKLEVWPGMVHVFQIRGLPESRMAIEHIAEFVHSQAVSR